MKDSKGIVGVLYGIPVANQPKYNPFWRRSPHQVMVATWFDGINPPRPFSSLPGWQLLNPNLNDNNKN